MNVYYFSFDEMSTEEHMYVRNRVLCVADCNNFEASNKITTESFLRT